MRQGHSLLLTPVATLQTGGLCIQAFLKRIFWETKLLPPRQAQVSMKKSIVNLALTYPL